MSKLLNKAGQCPHCGSDGLDYECMEPEYNNMVYYPWTCLDCGAKGEEWYTMTFTGHCVETEDDCMEEVDEINKKEEK